MMVRQEMITKMRQVANKILPAGGTVLLYGSRARGDARDTSDWDLLILLDKATIEEKDYDEIVDYAINLGINNAFCQIGGTVSESFVPEFNYQGIKKTL